MRPCAITLLAGALCVPATHAVTSAGNFRLTLLIAIVVAAVSAAISMYHMRKTGRSVPWWAPPLAFVLGTFAAEGVAVAGYGASFGWDAARLGAGLRLAGIEAAALSVVGSISVVMAQLLLRWANGASKAAK
ncbi:MAG: hypothetical protein ACK4N4_10965 [Burkholderiales bacterium]